MHWSALLFDAGFLKVLFFFFFVLCEIYVYLTLLSVLCFGENRFGISRRSPASIDRQNTQSDTGGSGKSTPSWQRSEDSIADQMGTYGALHGEQALLTTR